MNPTKNKQMTADLLEAHLAQAVADLGPLFTSYKLKEELFAYCETTEIDVSYSYFFTKKSGHQRRRTHEVIITPESVLLPERMKIKWDHLEDFLILVEANVHKEGKDPLKGYVICSK
jgi:hypothetical protein